jgi:hypothetical protein
MTCHISKQNDMTYNLINLIKRDMSEFYGR